MRHPSIMVDLETMDVGPTASILTIGAVYFDPYGKDTEETFLDQHKFQVTASLESNMKLGRTVSASTIMWWMQQSQEAQSGLYEGEIDNITTALVKFRKWIHTHTPIPARIWAKDPDFDVVILVNAFQQVGEMWPFKFWESRSVRTITEDAYPDGDAPQIGVGVAHNAMDDSLRQALMVQHCKHVLEGRVNRRTH